MDRLCDLSAVVSEGGHVYRASGLISLMRQFHCALLSALHRHLREKTFRHPLHARLQPFLVQIP